MLLLLAGCGGGSGRSATAPAVTAAPSAPRQVALTTTVPAAQSAQGRQGLVNSVCLAVRHGAPRALAPPFTAQRLSRYVAGAGPVARRVEVSLRRIDRSGPAPELTQLVRELTQLRATYAAVPMLAAGHGGAARAGAEIVAREGAASATARRAGFPACAVA